MASDIDEQPPSRPPRPRPDAPRRRPPSRAELKAAQRRATASAPARRARPPAPASRRPPPVADDGYDDDAGPAALPPARSQNKLIIVLSVLTVVAVGLVALAVALNNRTADNGPAPAVAVPVPTTTFRDAATGLTVDYPRSWRKVDVPVADYRLAVDGGSNVAFTIRVVPIQTPATAANLENFKAVTDGLVGSNSTVQVLKNQAISLNGMLGYYYFYTFVDGGVAAVHAHYFLFSGNKMNVLVFQSLPDDFQNLAATFDKIAESFRSDPNVPSAAAAPSSTTPTTAR
jgi:hypothetical protein